MWRSRTAFLLTLALSLALVALSPAARAQTTDLAGRLPADTTFYVYWRGAGSLTPGNRDALVSLWNDPGFQPARQLILQGLENAAVRNPRLARLKAGDLDALLADPFVFGIRLATQGKSGRARRSQANGFLVAESGGAAGRDLRADLESGPKGAANVRFTRSGLLLASGDPATLDELVRQFGDSASGTGESLSTLAAFHEARAEIAGQPAVEFFLHVPELSSLGAQTASGFNTGAFLRSLHIERVHLLCGSIDFNAPEALAHFAILGDAAPGSIFDLFGGNVASFPTLAAAPADASISIHRFDIGSVLSLLTNAFSAAMEPNQAARLEIISGLLSGMVVPALGGEYATVWPHLTSGTAPLMLVLTVNSPAAERLFSTALAPYVKPDGEEGGIRYFRPPGNSPGPARNAAGQKPAASRGSTLIALTPNLVLAGADNSLVRRTARAVTAQTPPQGLAESPGFLAARAEFPAKLSGLSYFDLQAFDWTKWLDTMATGMAANKKDPRAAQRAAQLRKWADGGGGAVLARHLHLIASGAWKDDQGIHWRANIH
jgi:hypothetical protein